MPVSIGEQYSGGAGPTLRATIWFSAATAARMVGRSLTDYCLKVDMASHVDGPSAGALTTAAMMAAMLGVPLRGDTTLTGTINIGGVVGRVGGVEAKLHAAATVARDRVGVPGDQPAPQLKRLAALAKIREVKLTHLDTVADAFRLLTGRKLPGGPALTEDEMALPPEIRRIARERANDLSTKAGKNMAAAQLKNSVPPLFQAAIEGQVKLLKQDLLLAEDLLKMDAPVPALFAAAEGYSRAAGLKQAVDKVRGATPKQLGARLLAVAKEAPAGDVSKRASRNVIMTGGSISRRAGEVALAVEMNKATQSARWLLHGKPDEAKLADAFRELIRVHTIRARSVALDPLSDRVGDGFMVHQENLKRAANALAVEAEARQAYAKAIHTVHKGKREELMGVRRAAGHLGFSEAYAKEYQAAWPLIVLLGSARAALHSTASALITTERPSRGSSDSSVALSDRLVRTYSALIKQQTGFVPLMARIHYRVAKDLLARKWNNKARLALDAAGTECLMWLWLHGGDRRKDPIDQASKAVPYVAPVEEG